MVVADFIQRAEEDETKFLFRLQSFYMYTRQGDKPLLFYVILIEMIEQII